jgi:hypothetical protein
MTAQTDLDGKLRAWLDLMPGEAPDRAIAAVLEAVEATPQPRWTPRWPLWRPFTMNRIPFVVGAAAVVAVVGMLLLTRHDGGPTVGASAPPGSSAAAVASATASVAATPAGSASVGLGQVPTALQHRWMGATSPLVRAEAGTSMLIAANSLSVNEAASDNAASFTGSVGASAADRLDVSDGGAQARCEASPAATYAWSLSRTGRVLTLQTGDDSCAIRSGALPGTWWQMGCKDPNDDCLGLLDAGTYRSQFINPLAASSTPWRPRFGAITYTVPDGWANDADWPTRFSLSTAESFAMWTKDNGAPAGVGVFADAHASSQATPCSGKPDDRLAATPAAIVAALRHVRGLTVGPSTPVAIDGHSGVQVDLGADDATLRPCGTDRLVEYLYAGEEGLAIDPTTIQRLILLDVGNTTLAIEISSDTVGFDALANAAISVIASMHFQ